MNNIFWLIGVIVVVLAILSFFGLRWSGYASGKARSRGIFPRLRTLSI